MSAGLLLASVVAVGCSGGEVSGGVGPGPDADPVAPGPAQLAPDAGAPGPAQGSPDSRPATPAPSPDARPAAAPDAGGAQPKPYPTCAWHTVSSNACGVLGSTGSDWLNQKKDGYICRICRLADASGKPDFSQPQQTGCLIGIEGVMVLCVSSCGECAF